MSMTFEIQTLTPAEAIQRAEVEGAVEIDIGVFLNRRDTFLHFKDGKFTDLTGAPFWINSEVKGLLLPVHGADDENLINALAAK